MFTVQTSPNPISYHTMDAFQAKIPALPLFHIPGQTGSLAGYRPWKEFSRSLSNETHSPAVSIPSWGRPKHKAMEDQDTPIKKSVKIQQELLLLLANR